MKQTTQPKKENGIKERNIKKEEEKKIFKCTESKKKLCKKRSYREE